MKDMLKKVKNGTATTEEVNKAEKYIEEGIDYVAAMKFALGGQKDEKAEAEYRKLQEASNILRPERREK